MWRSFSMGLGSPICFFSIVCQSCEQLVPSLVEKPVLCRSNFLFQTLIGSPIGNNRVAPNYYSCNISCLMGKVHRKPSKLWLQTHLIESHILDQAYLGLSPRHETGEDLVTLTDGVLLQPDCQLLPAQEEIAWKNVSTQRQAKKLPS